METICIVILMAITHHGLFAQVPITLEANGFRDGDKLCKVLVDYVSPNDGGTCKVWPIGRITKSSNDFIQTVISARDTIAILESERIRHCLVSGNSLVDKGQQSRRSYCTYNQERPLIRYPFQYGDSISGYFSGFGQEEKITTSRTGWGYTVADGTGVLTDGEDTIPHITRIHFHDDYTDTFNASDTVSLRTVCDRYSWYCAGYRYPIMESVHWSSIDGDSQKHPLDSITFLFLPVMQMELEEDVVNDSILNEMNIADALNTTAESEQNSILSAIEARLSDDGTHLNISYTLQDNSSLDFCACDILGNIIGQAHYSNKTAGEWQECIILSHHPISNALMLNIKCGRETKSIKVYQ